ncbi:gluconate 2-dehydrogenase subunit 3 family protein [Virgibacillus sp. NKC19-3]|uniref:gluconate 2-dehydrogenase subunit 3 family protein n=1 Tax=Virgibacillus saliphilus TaxID=2831674 RepID=UPI001C9A4E92|nr:gluconate 2-dehydrogenase subunit 3 family protein [Virgibacillus sp. NKC19-3]MBY7144689.1 gluconate 2-dehydrogenase subunit 3 family protein [Virgibacillus sp. NKC19-3]
MANNGPVNNKDKQANDKKDVSRRQFLKNSGYAAGGVVGGALLGGLISNPFQTEETAGTDENTQAKEPLQEARTFFSRSEDFQTLAAATERIYPENENGPGAIELGVPYFIDKQLAGFWGSNSRDYTKGPFDPKASDTHGFQSKLNRGEMFLVGLRRMQEVSQEQHEEEFFDLDGEAQDDILVSFESGDVGVTGMRSETFFELLRQTTIEGVYSDPAYGGNKDMQGWEMMEYPGPRMGWMDDIEAEDFVSKAPKSLRSYQGGGL